MGNISAWNAQIDRSNTVYRLGKNGIYYEYIMPLHSNPITFYKDAIDVRSRKSASSKWNNGKKPGQYQPIGDKRYFNYYQLKKMSQDELIDFIVTHYADTIAWSLLVKGDDI